MHSITSSVVSNWSSGCPPAKGARAMKRSTWFLTLCVLACGLLCGGLLLSSHLSLAAPYDNYDPAAGLQDCYLNLEGRLICSNYCGNFKLESIPVGDFFHLGNPVSTNKNIESATINQDYNEPIDQAWCDAPGYSKPPAYPSQECTDYHDSLCQKDPASKGCTSFETQHVFYGHSGIDIHAKTGDDLYAVQPLFVVASHKTDGSKKSWGESIIGATRVSASSKMIVTFHYHHFQADLNPYRPTRRYNACEEVPAGAILAKAGMTGFATGPHLHLTVRVWNDVDELKTAIKKAGVKGQNLYGPGYADWGNEGALQGDTSNYKSGHYLDPLRLLKGTYSEEEQKQYTELMTYMKDIRRLGADFGEYDGSFGAGKPVLRGEAARWFNVATRKLIPLSEQIAQKSVVFPNDVPKKSLFFEYVQNLSYYPYPDSTDPSANVVNRAPLDHLFHPNDNLQRAQALKMTILAFYDSEFKQYLSNHGTSKYLFSENAHWFLDVLPAPPLPPFFTPAWYYDYVYFGLQQCETNSSNQKECLVSAEHNSFEPTKEATKAALAKWVSFGRRHKFGKSSDPCESKTCDPSNSDISKRTYCVDGVCEHWPSCVPAENTECAVGGGSDSCSTSPQCNIGDIQTQPCNGSGMQSRSCQSDCTWSAWGSCVTNGVCSPGQNAQCQFCGTQTCDANNQWGACLNQGVCSPGQVQSQICNGSGTQTMTCGSNCQWGPWGACSTTPVCTPGQNAQCQYCGTQTCDANGQWGACLNQGVCTPGASQPCAGGGTQACNTNCQWGTCAVCSAGATKSVSCTLASFYCPQGTATETCVGGQWSSPSTCQAPARYYGDGGVHCGSVSCLQISSGGSNSALQATLTKNGGNFQYNVDVIAYSPSTGQSYCVGQCLPTSGKPSYSFSINPASLGATYATTIDVNLNVYSPCGSGACGASGTNYISGAGQVSQCAN